MCRNLRVKRTLVEWRQEGNSYVSIIPRDILTLILPYLPPDIWKEKAIVEEIWSWVSNFELTDIDTNFLAEGSVVIGGGREGAIIVNPIGETTLCNGVIRSENYIFKNYYHPDLIGGFWYGVADYRANLFTMHHYHVEYEKRKPSVACSLYGSSWQIKDFVMLENGSYYLINHGYDGTSRLVRCNAGGLVEYKYKFGHQYIRLDYRKGKLYLFDDLANRFQVDQPLTSQLDFDPTIMENGIYNKHHPVADYEGDTQADVFYLREKPSLDKPRFGSSNHLGVYLLSPNCQEEDIFLWAFPEGMNGLKLQQTSSGELLLLVQEKNKFILSRLY